MADFCTFTVSSRTMDWTSRKRARLLLDHHALVAGTAASTPRRRAPSKVMSSGLERQLAQGLACLKLCQGCRCGYRDIRPCRKRQLPVTLDTVHNLAVRGASVSEYFRHGT